MDTPLSGESESKSPNPETQSNSSQNIGSAKGWSNLIPWKKGQSGNPGGRPSRLPITEAYRAIGKRRAVDVNPGMLDVLKRAGFEVTDETTMNEVLALTQFMESLKGETKAASEITDRVEGKAIQRVELTGAEGGPVESVDLSRLTDAQLAEYQRLQSIVTISEAEDKSNE